MHQFHCTTLLNLLGGLDHPSEGRVVVDGTELNAVSATTIALSVAGILGVLLLAQWPALRSVGRMSLADAVRSREG